MTKDSYKCIVLDSGPIIQNSFPHSLAETFYTVPEVISEIKDAATRELMKCTPYTLKIMNPSVAAMEQVRAFAKETGDLATLSVVDLRVAALTLTLELQANGEKSRVRKDPSEMKIHQGGPPQVKKEITALAVVIVKQENSIDNVIADEEDAGEWITPDNIHQIKAKESHKTLASTEGGLITIGCISTDFALQNLLLQMRLKVFGTEGFRIRKVKNWLLRCHGCYWTTKQADRRFCDRCGGNTLTRTSYMVDEKGEVHLFLKKDFQYNLRGTKAPLPMPKPGRDGNRILLREDQKEYEQAVKSHKWAERKHSVQVSDLDSIDDRLSTIFGAMNVKGSSKNFDGLSLPTIGFGRRNPNQSKRKV